MWAKADLEMLKILCPEDRLDGWLPVLGDGNSGNQQELTCSVGTFNWNKLCTSQSSGDWTASVHISSFVIVWKLVLSLGPREV